MILALVLAIVAVALIGVYAVIDTAMGPDPDLTDAPACPGCGSRGGRHVHPGWETRRPR